MLRGPGAFGRVLSTGGDRWSSSSSEETMSMSVALRTVPCRSRLYQGQTIEKVSFGYDQFLEALGLIDSAYVTGTKDTFRSTRPSGMTSPYGGRARRAVPMASHVVQVILDRSIWPIQFDWTVAHRKFRNFPMVVRLHKVGRL
jgi:hypothetical protein